MINLNKLYNIYEVRYVPFHMGPIHVSFILREFESMEFGTLTLALFSFSCVPLHSFTLHHKKEQNIKPFFFINFLEFLEFHVSDMASNQEATIPLKFWVDEEQNSIIVAEASGDFVDVLFSFLTLPLGTIIKLVSKNQPHQPLEIGCIDNLYQSAENFNPNVFWNRICQQMLLSPRNPSESACHRLKLKVDHTVPTKYFMCNYCSKGSKLLLSTFVDASCYCGKWMKKEIKLLEESKEEGSWGNGVFVKGDAMFLIFDDLRVLNSSPGNTVQQLLQLGYKDLNKLKEMPVNVGMKEVILF